MAKRGPKPINPQLKILKENICLQKREWEEISEIIPGLPARLTLRLIVSRWLSIRRKRQGEAL